MPDLDLIAILYRARGIGNDLAQAHPPVFSYHVGARAIPPDAVKPVADAITAVVAEILQAWLDAGSERDVTFEELGPAIEDHVRGWSTDSGE